MPARVIRAEINSSRSLSRVSLQADLIFRALIVAVDDFGRFDADLPMLKLTLFPRRPAVTEEQIAGWLAELAGQRCLVLYESDGNPYLALVNWEKYRGSWKRTKRGKYPAPPEVLPESPRISRNLPESPAQSGLSLGLGFRLRSGAEAAGPEPEAARASQAARPPEKSQEPETEPDAPSTGVGAWSPPAEKRESLATSTVFAECKAALAVSRA